MFIRVEIKAKRCQFNASVNCADTIVRKKFFELRRKKNLSGSELVPGDNVSLLNFSEKLNAATKILQGCVEREASVATNLRKIVNRLPNDLVAKWQTGNYACRASPSLLKSKL